MTVQSDSQDMTLPPTQGWESFDEWRKGQGILENPKSNGEEVGVRRDEMGRVLPGTVLNPAGRPLGTENFKTIFEKALKKVATLNDIDPDDLYAQIISKGITQARSGDYRFYKDTLDRLHGKPKDTVAMDMTTGGLPIQGGNQITFVHFSNDSESKL